MQRYLQQLITDLEAAILARWQERPPHYFEMGIINEPGLTPPAGYTGPPAGFGHDNPRPLPKWMLGEAEDEAAEEPSSTEIDPKTAETIAEMEQWRDEDSPKRQDMFYHFGFESVQFPPAEQLTDTNLNTLSSLLIRLWAAYNFTAVVPQHAPGRVIYPILLKRMEEATFVMKHGHIGVEFCEYEPTNCPFGEAWCTSKNH